MLYKKRGLKRYFLILICFSSYSVLCIYYYIMKRRQGKEDKEIQLSQSIIPDSPLIHKLYMNLCCHQERFSCTEIDKHCKEYTIKLVFYQFRKGAAMSNLISKFGNVANSNLQQAGKWLCKYHLRMLNKMLYYY